MNLEDTRNRVPWWYPVLIFLICIGFVTACGLTQQAQNIQVVWHSGECFLMVDNLTVEQAQEVQKEWSLEHCRVEVKKASE